MGTERLSMRNIQEILRQKWVLGCSHRAVAQSLGVSVGAVTETVRRATAAGFDWAQVAPATDAELEQRLYRRPAGSGSLRRGLVISSPSMISATRYSGTFMRSS